MCNCLCFNETVLIRFNKSADLNFFYRDIYFFFCSFGSLPKTLQKQLHSELRRKDFENTPNRSKTVQKTLREHCKTLHKHT